MFPLLLAMLQAPAQFSGLPPDSTDYTCAGTQPCSTWAMPPQPAAGGSYTDPVYGTTTWRLAPTAANTNGNIMPIYSRVLSWSADGKRMLVAEAGTVYDDLYDATTTPPTPINRITLTDGQIVDGVDNDVLWANTSNGLYFTLYHNSGHGTELRYVDITNCTAANCTLTSQIIHTFSCATDATSSLGSGVAGDKIETGSGAQGGMFTRDDRYFAFTCDKVDGIGRHEIDFISYDRQTDTFTSEKWYNLCPGQTPSGCRAYLALGKDADLIRMNVHPAGYALVIWQNTSAAKCGGLRCDCPTETSWVRSCGTEVYDMAYNFLGPASPENTHQDTGYDINGDPVWVGASYGGTVKDYRALAITNLSALNPAKITSKHILLPCSYSYVNPAGSCDSGTFVYSSKSWHVSMQAQALPGWMLLSTFLQRANPTATPPNAGWGAQELVAVKVDDKAADYSQAIFYRIGRTHGISDNQFYNCEAHGTVNRDFTQILWASSWDQACTANSAVNGYWMPLIKTRTFTLSCPLTITQGIPFSCTVQ